MIYSQHPSRRFGVNYEYVKRRPQAFELLASLTSPISVSTLKVRKRRNLENNKGHVIPAFTGIP